MTKKLILIALMGLVLCWASLASAATDTKNLTINATVAARATLTLSN